MKELLIVACGSFLGGGLRYGVSRLLALCVSAPFPWATFVVNVVGCLLIGLVSALPGGIGPNTQTRLFLTTGLCGGFTTFSTFMNESAGLLKAGEMLLPALYVLGSFALGMLAFVAGHWLGSRMF